MLDLARPDLKKFLPNADDETIDAILLDEDWLDSQGLLASAGIWCVFIAQCAHESQGLTKFEEGMNYRVSRLCAVFPKHFPTEAAATPFARNPEALANCVYADASRDPKHRLGNTAQGDGWKYRARGLIGLTGKDAYAAAGAALGLPLVDDPDQVSTPAVAVKTAAWFFVSKGCIPLAAKGNFDAVTKRINGGTNGKDSRAEWLRKAQAIWGSNKGLGGALQTIAKSPSLKAGTTAVATTAVAVAGKTTEVVAGGDALGSLKTVGETAKQIQDSSGPIIKLWEFALANLWAGVSVVLFATVCFMGYRHLKAYVEGRLV